MMILKIILISLFIDMYLFFFHRFYHWEKAPAFIRNAHLKHHKDFSRDNVFAVHPTELVISTVPGFLFSWWLTGPIFAMVVVFWGLFEASRGHGHYKWFKIIPKSFYRRLQYCGMRYHAYHHEVDETKNMGQFLKVWDIICGTKAAAF